MDVALPEDAVARFRADVTALTGADERLGVAVSGGPDSLALLLLAAAAFPGRIAAATVDHGLRAESAAEAQFVAGVCRRLGVPHSVLAAEVDRTRSSLQRAAREARHAALGAWMAGESIGWLATAHHADDQAETLMMRLLRGSGVAGLAGIRAAAPMPWAGGGRLVRPLLDWRRDELRALVEGAGIAPIEDPSNRDERFDRTRVRQALAEAGWLDTAPLARSASALADAEEALAWTTDRLLSERAASDGDALHLDPAGLPRELRRRLIAALLAKVGDAPAPPRGEELVRLLDRLEQGGTATLAGVKCSAGQNWRFEPAPARRTR